MPFPSLHWHSNSDTIFHNFFFFFCSLPVSNTSSSLTACFSGGCFSLKSPPVLLKGGLFPLFMKFLWGRRGISPGQGSAVDVKTLTAPGCEGFWGVSCKSKWSSGACSILPSPVCCARVWEWSRDVGAGTTCPGMVLMAFLSEREYLKIFKPE